MILRIFSAVILISTGVSAGIHDFNAGLTDEEALHLALVQSGSIPELPADHQKEDAEPLPVLRQLPAELQNFNLNLTDDEAFEQALKESLEKTQSESLHAPRLNSFEENSGPQRAAAAVALTPEENQRIENENFTTSVNDLRAGRNIFEARERLQGWGRAQRQAYATAPVTKKGIIALMFNLRKEECKDLGVNLGEDLQTCQVISSYSYSLHSNVETRDGRVIREERRESGHLPQDWRFS